MSQFTITNSKYNNTGNYIVTIELSKSRRNRCTYFCRVYTNWEAVPPIRNGLNTSIRARIADKVTPTNTNENCLEIIELPIQDTPKQISCCQVNIVYIIKFKIYSCF